ncbi:MAG: esterase [Nitrosomonadales bacterium]|nr:esterase [Nitrosomonadales bacterium]
MAEQIFRGIELLPKTRAVRQLFILLHGVGATPSDLAPLANTLRDAFPDAAFLLPGGTFPFDGGGSRRQWFSINGVTEANRPARVAEAIPALHALVRQAQGRFRVLQPDTALVGFSQGAIMALEFSVAHDGSIGRVVAFSGRFAQLPDKAPGLTTLHLLHGEDDPVIPVRHAYAAYDRLTDVHGDATLDVASAVGHEIHAALAGRAVYRLQTCVPLRSWKQALGSA